MTYHSDLRRRRRARRLRRFLLSRKRQLRHLKYTRDLTTICIKGKTHLEVLQTQPQTTGENDHDYDNYRRLIAVN